jgi:hypothetical protein
MIRFDPYPITINGSYIDEMVRRLAEEGHQAGLFDINRKMKMLREANRFDYVNDVSRKARAYEARIRALLSTMVRTEAGRCLLNHFKGGLPIWIIPYDSSQQKVFGRCNSNAGYAVSEHLNNTAAVRVAFSPELWSFSECGQYPGMRADEVLFHELVHAYRFASPYIPQLNNDPLPDNQDHEEFLATQLTNVYRATKGAQRFNRDYMSKLLGTAEECERALWSWKALLDAIDLFMTSDPLVQAVARISTSYNPFARIGHLKKQREEHAPGTVRIHGGQKMPQPIP